MHAMKLTGLRRMVMQDVPMAAIARDTDVLIRVARVGICGSDVHYFDEGGIGTQRVEYPWAVGHEGAGVVEAIGAAVTRVKPGDRIAFDPALPCGECDQCRAGRPHTCRAQKFLGCPDQIEGCLAEYLVMPERNCYPIPNTMTWDEAAIVEPLSIGIYALSLAGAMDGAKIGILGAGPIGLSVLLPARAQGASRVYITDKINARLQVASRAGADWTGNPDSDDVVGEITRREPELLDYVFECSGSQDAMDQGIELLKPGGKLLLIGIPAGTNRVSFDINLLRRKELIIQNVRRQNNTVQRAIDMIADKEIDVNVMVTHHLPFARTQEGFDMVADYQDGVVKAMVTFD
ncbi:MAG: alcohol dehydrogenase catalytic domain-containing protein [Armatimonadetes bacterium]|nr:alcohol dehydrogenase catalytic domain-containing protein [Armatimonadota bacterium]